MVMVVETEVADQAEAEVAVAAREEVIAEARLAAAMKAAVVPVAAALGAELDTVTAKAVAATSVASSVVEVTLLRSGTQYRRPHTNRSGPVLASHSRHHSSRHLPPRPTRHASSQLLVG